MKQLMAWVLGVMLWAVPVSAASVDRAAITTSVNALRAEKNIAALSYSPALEKIARAHAEDMARNGFFSHTGSDGSSNGKRLNRAGYNWCTAAENIAKGQKTVADVMNTWSNSRAHRKNMLNKRISEFALARGAGDIWVMVLAKPGC